MDVRTTKYFLEKVLVSLCSRKERQVIKQRDDVVYLCIMCGEPVPEYEPQMCCDGKECACMGLPIEPPLCSFECGEKLYHPEAK